jgi:putative transcriptional regulator
MPLTYKIDALDALKQNGYSTYRIRKEKLLGESTLQKLRQGLPVSWENIETICRLLHCQPGDMLEYAEDKMNDKKEDGN